MPAPRRCPASVLGCAWRKRQQPPAAGTGAPTTPPEETRGGVSPARPLLRHPRGFCGVAASGAVPPAHLSPVSPQAPRLTFKYTDYFKKKKNRFFFISKSPCSAPQSTTSPGQGAPPPAPAARSALEGAPHLLPPLVLGIALGSAPLGPRRGPSCSCGPRGGARGRWGLREAPGHRS